jgi:hypothetical protein
MFVFNIINIINIMLSNKCYDTFEYTGVHRQARSRMEASSAGKLAYEER